MASLGYHQKFEFEALKDVNIFVKNGNLFLEKKKIKYTIHSNGSVTHEEPVVIFEEVPLNGYGYSAWDFVPSNESHPEKPNFYKK